MRTVKMIADKEFPYRGVRMPVGSTLDVEEGHVQFLTVAGLAHVETVKDTGYQTRMMTANKRRVKARG